MPAKFKPSEKVRNRQTGKVTTEHYYLKQMPADELIKYINDYSAKPKRRIKCINEITRRGLNINWVVQNGS
jgi:hypothetical protein